MGTFIVTLARWTQPNFVEKARQSGRLQLLTIPYSHYVEVARWSLQIGNIKFVEHQFSPMQHIIPVISVRIRPEQITVPTTTTTKIIRPESINKDDKKKKSATAGATSVPLAILPSGQVMADSWDIAQYSGTSPISDTMKQILDDELGPFVRQYTYYFLLKPSNHNVWDRLVTG